jgi:hypothetical protein
MPVLTVQNALVRSATVEIKSLTVSGRQVTQAVFRQVPYLPILQADGSLAGTPWGWVNYWWKDNEEIGLDPLHVLWQEGGELRRAIVDRFTPHIVDRTQHHRQGPAHQALRVHRELIHARLLRLYEHYWFGGHRDERRSMTLEPFGRIEVETHQSQQLTRAINLVAAANEKSDHEVRSSYRWLFDEHAPYGKPTASLRDEMLAAADAIGKERLAGDTREAARARVVDSCRAAILLREAWRASYDTCHAAGQLFIAC